MCLLAAIALIGSLGRPVVPPPTAHHTSGHRSTVTKPFHGYVATPTGLTSTYLWRHLDLSRPSLRANIERLGPYEVYRLNSLV